MPPTTMMPALPPLSYMMDDKPLTDTLPSITLDWDDTHTYVITAHNTTPWDAVDITAVCNFPCTVNVKPPMLRSGQKATITITITGSQMWDHPDDAPLKIDLQNRYRRTKG